MPGRGVQGRGPAGGTSLAGAARRALGQVREAHTYRRAYFARRPPVPRPCDARGASYAGRRAAAR